MSERSCCLFVEMTRKNVQVVQMEYQHMHMMEENCQLMRERYNDQVAEVQHHLQELKRSLHFLLPSDPRSGEVIRFLKTVLLKCQESNQQIAAETSQLRMASRSAGGPVDVLLTSIDQTLKLSQMHMKICASNHQTCHEAFNKLFSEMSIKLKWLSVGNQVYRQLVTYQKRTQVLERFRELIGQFEVSLDRWPRPRHKLNMCEPRATPIPSSTAFDYVVSLLTGELLMSPTSPWCGDDAGTPLLFRWGPDSENWKSGRSVTEQERMKQILRDVTQEAVLYQEIGKIEDICIRREQEQGVTGNIVIGCRATQPSYRPAGDLFQIYHQQGSQHTGPEYQPVGSVPQACGPSELQQTVMQVYHHQPVVSGPQVNEQKPQPQQMMQNGQSMGNGLQQRALLRGQNYQPVGSVLQAHVTKGAQPSQQVHQDTVRNVFQVYQQYQQKRAQQTMQNYLPIRNGEPAFEQKAPQQTAYVHFQSVRKTQQDGSCDRERSDKLGQAVQCFQQQHRLGQSGSNRLAQQRPEGWYGEDPQPRRVVRRSLVFDEPGWAEPASKKARLQRTVGVTRGGAFTLTNQRRTGLRTFTVATVEALPTTTASATLTSGIHPLAGHVRRVTPHILRKGNEKTFEIVPVTSSQANTELGPIKLPTLRSNMKPLI